MKKLVYSKHSAQEQCGVAYFSREFARHIGAKHINSFHGFSQCDELFINMDIFELDESEISSLLNFIESSSAKKTIILMHDYRFSYLEDQLIKACDMVVNLSGEPALKNIAKDKMIELFTPSSIELPILDFQKKYGRPLSLSFGFFSPRKKSFKLYISFYEYMLKKYPNWFHIIAISRHIGSDENDVQILSRFFESDSVLVQGFLPNQLLTELISVSDLGVSFYPTGIMINNAAPMSFFSQGKPVITSYGDLTPEIYKNFTLDINKIDSLPLSNLRYLKKLGTIAKIYYWKNLSWEVFIDQIYTKLKKL